MGIALARLPSMGSGGLMPLPLLYQARSAVNVPAMFSGVATLMAVIQAAILPLDISFANCDQAKEPTIRGWEDMASPPHRSTNLCPQQPRRIKET
jgi:hypothetical protein